MILPQSSSSLTLPKPSIIPCIFQDSLTAVTTNTQLSVTENNKGLFLGCEALQSVCVCV